jgi:hypothetical protein
LEVFLAKNPLIITNSGINTPMVFKEEGSKMINISLKFNDAEEHEDSSFASSRKFLAYPLKENRSVDSYCINIEIKQLKEFSNMLYVEAKDRQRKKAAAKEDKLSKYEAYCYHIDERVCSHFNIDSKYGKIRLFFKEKISSENLIPFVSLETDLYYFNQMRSGDAKEHCHPKQVIYNMEKWLFAAGHYSVGRHFRF